MRKFSVGYTNLEKKQITAYTKELALQSIKITVIKLLKSIGIRHWQWFYLIITSFFGQENKTFSVATCIKSNPVNVKCVS